MNFVSELQTQLQCKTLRLYPINLTIQNLCLNTGGFKEIDLNNSKNSAISVEVETFVMGMKKVLCY
jgi:hypothetical protein